MEQFTQDGQDVKIIEKLISKVQDMLTPGEKIDYIAIQKKPAVTILPDSITISNKRIFMCEFTKLGLATDFEIFAWQDIKDIAFKEEIFGSKVTVIPLTGENLSIDYIPKVQARKLYQYIKAALENYKKEQEPTPTPAPVPEPAVAVAAPQHTLYPDVPVEEEDDEITLKLKKLKTLFDKQLITKEEYENKKKEVLSSL